MLGTCAHTMPPRLWAMKIRGRLIACVEVLKPLKAAERLEVWSLTLAVEVGSRTCAMSASSPHVMIRASGISRARRLYGQKTSSFVQVDTRPPPSPCTKQILAYISAEEHERHNLHTQQMHYQETTESQDLCHLRTCWPFLFSNYTEIR